MTALYVKQARLDRPFSQDYSKRHNLTDRKFVVRVRMVFIMGCMLIIGIEPTFDAQSQSPENEESFVWQFPAHSAHVPAGN